MSNAIDLTVRLGSLVLKNPFIVGSGPATRSVEQIRAAEDAGWAGASLKLTIGSTSQSFTGMPPRYRWFRKSRMHAFTAEKRLTLGEGLRLTERARKAVSGIAIFPNIAYDGMDCEDWAAMAKRFQEAGAHGIELNMCCPNTSYNLLTVGRTAFAADGRSPRGRRPVNAMGASLGADLVELPRIVQAVVESVRIPVLVKLTPEGGGIAEAAAASIKAGAVAVGSTANRLGIPDIDIRDPSGGIFRLQEGMSLTCLSGPWIRPLGLRDTFEMRRTLGKTPFIIGSGGVSDLASAVRQIMAGADAVWICTETMVRGFAWMSRLLGELTEYMAEMGWSRISDFRDVLTKSLKPAADLLFLEGHAEVDSKECNGCGACWDMGHCAALSHPRGVTMIDPALCTACSTCADLCLRGAISISGKEKVRA